ncbi:hypothetical protein [Hymenobacter canadensis]|uniref:Uncharacterized protein n=1 Tax=Hymenobacter canadensis TaxID=2999067 RepID=A0ABY7LQ97_9BACT|nr:hypothetical protein [Hymenobacter canadensis]WBA41617.1 hypothetical protein O3303_17600 [Hymenobacter canadensis]
MHRLGFLLVCVELGLLAACGQLQEARNSYKAAASSVQTARTMGAALRKQQQQLAVRAAHGDTVVLPYQELARYLPARLAGFEAVSEPKGESISLNGVSYSSCERRYRKGKQHLKAQLVDYNGATALYAGATAMMAAGFVQEDDEQLVRSCNLGVHNIRGWENLQKREHKASIALGVGDRFFVVVESDGQNDTDVVKQVARNIDLQALARL